MAEGESEFKPSHYITEQYALISAVEKILRNFKKDSTARKTKSYFETRLETTLSLRSEFRENHRRLVRWSSDAEVKKSYIDAEVNDKFEELYIDVVSTIKEASSSVFVPQQSVQNLSTPINSTLSSSSFTNEIPLPEVKLPMFSGIYTEWPTFKEVFLSRVHNSERLSDCQRFHYLKGALAGDAAQDIQHISLLGENYQGAWKMLVDMYDNDKILFSHYMDVFDQLSPVHRDDPTELRRFTQTCRSCVNSIQKLGVEVEDHSEILVYYMLKKLPVSVQNEWDRALRKQKAIPKFSQLCTVLDDYHQMLIASSKSNKQTSLRQHIAPLSQRKMESATHPPKGGVKSYGLKKSVLCPICSKGEHPVRECEIFLGLRVAERRGSVEKHKLCFNCLGYNHVSSKCSSSRTCTRCGGKHHTLIHMDRNMESNTSSSHIAITNSSSSVNDSNLTNSASDTSAISSCLNQGRYDVLLPTAVVAIINAQGQPTKFRTFLDQGSQASFISERAVQQLRLPRKSVHITVSGLSETLVAMGRSCVKLEIGSLYKPTIRYTVFAYVLPKVSHSMPDNLLSTDKWIHLKELELADPKYFEPQKVDVLLGNDVYDEIMLNDIRRAAKGMPIAQQTTLGYIVSGKATRASSVVDNISSWYTKIEDDHLLRRFWEIEEIRGKRTLSNLDQWCEDFYQKTHQRQENGKYLVRLPLLSEIDPLSIIGTSRHMALKRFMHLENRLARDLPLKKTYEKVIEEYRELGQMKAVVTSELDHQVVTKSNVCHSTCCYLPHHPVIKESSSTTKVRIVFDASAKTSNGKSLNDILAIGPALQNDLAAVLINWRVFKFVYITDIEKMYRSISIHEDDTKYQRILWRCDQSDELKEYSCSTVMFGTASAPFCAIRTMHQLAEDEAHNYPLAVDIIKNQMYVDDILSGSHTIEEALEAQRQVIAMLRSGTFELRKWSSNHPSLLSRIPTEHQETKNLLLLNGEDSVKTLGMYWNPKEDEFTFKVNFSISIDTPTKRNILSSIARLFDPLGWLNPVVITAKILMQRLWISKVGWDNAVPEDVQKSWKKYVIELPLLSQIQVPRWLRTSKTDRSRELHLFCDASIHAYSASVYLRVCDKDGNYQTNLIIAKCKVAPIKPKLSIPRAELCGAVLAARLLKYVKQFLRLNIDESDTFLWTDSMIVLGWLRGDSNRWKVFISNRINKILDITGVEQWRHVISEENPADCSCRGLSPLKLAKHRLWWSGPPWLQAPIDEWPKLTTDNGNCLATVEPEMKRVKVNVIHIDNNHLLSVIEKYSSFSHLLRIIAYCHRFIFNVRQTIRKRRYGALLVKELRHSLATIIRIVQQDSFSLEWKALSSKGQLPDNSTLHPLNPFFDEDEHVIRLGGRLRDSLLPPREKYPYILPSKHHVTDLIIRHSHLNTLHGGTAITLSHTRKQFWIINGRNVVRFAIHGCIQCHKFRPKIAEQLMGNLPANRVRPARAFSSVGVDYAGPIGILPSKGRGRKSEKGYIALFICLVTKAIHLEAVGDLSANAFIGAFKRFIGRRGLCLEIYSDCGTNFVGANRKLQEDKAAYKTFINSSISPFLLERGIQWNFIPPSSPHFGGLWEAGVKSMKYPLKRSIGDRKLTFEELSTVLSQIEACLNSRPLCPLSNDPNDFMVLTPGHFLIGDALLAPPVPEIVQQSLTDRWKNCQFLVQQFWRRWRAEYLSRLQRRPKWLQAKPNLQINDVVLIKDERYPCNQWLLGRVMETHPGRDNLVRVVTIKTQNGLIKRPITKVCPLPIQDNSEATSPNHNQTL